MTFNNGLAIIVICLTFTFALMSATLGWENQVVMLALGVFLGQSGQVVTFYFRKRPTEKEGNETTAPAGTTKPATPAGTTAPDRDPREGRGE